MAKKNQKSNMGAQKPQARLSQCMIVKNEERNIERALSWGKDIVCEQIVVDTGSTDRTIELAERMGAKVLHFEWVNDFSAAKNFAIGQASGNWVALLDADEYIPEEETGVVLPLLEEIMSDPKKRKRYLALNTPWVQLDDRGQPKEILVQERIFQNLPSVRYVRRIHEHLSLEPKDVVHTDDFRIMHTGYTGTSFLTTGKANRNIEMLRLELNENPKDMDIRIYLAESLLSQAALERDNIIKAGGDDKEAMPAICAILDEADALYREVLAGGCKVHDMLKRSTYDYFLQKYSNEPDADPQLDRLCERAYREYPKSPKFMCYYAMAKNKKGDYRGAMEILTNCERILSEAKETEATLTTAVTGLFARQMLLAGQGLGDTDTVMTYAEVLLMMEKGNDGLLRPYVANLVQRCRSIEEVLDKLANIYDMASRRDLLLIARVAKDVGAVDLARRIIDVAAYLGNDN